MLPGEGQVEKITLLGGRRRWEEEPTKVGVHYFLLVVLFNA